MSWFSVVYYKVDSRIARTNTAENQEGKRGLTNEHNKIVLNFIYLINTLLNQGL